MERGGALCGAVGAISAEHCDSPDGPECAPCTDGGAAAGGGAGVVVLESCFEPAPDVAPREPVDAPLAGTDTAAADDAEPLTDDESLDESQTDDDEPDEQPFDEPWHPCWTLALVLALVAIVAVVAYTLGAASVAQRRPCAHELTCAAANGADQTGAGAGASIAAPRDYPLLPCVRASRRDLAALERSLLAHACARSRLATMECVAAAPVAGSVAAANCSRSLALTAAHVGSSACAVLVLVLDSGGASGTGHASGAATLLVNPRRVAASVETRVSVERDTLCRVDAEARFARPRVLRVRYERRSADDGADGVEMEREFVDDEAAAVAHALDVLGAVRVCAVL